MDITSGVNNLVDGLFNWMSQGVDPEPRRSLVSNNRNQAGKPQSSAEGIDKVALRVHQELGKKMNVSVVC